MRSAARPSSLTIARVHNAARSEDDLVVAELDELGVDRRPAGRFQRRLEAPEQWTLRRQGGRWRVARVEVGVRGRAWAPSLGAPEDDPALAREARLELAARDVPGPGSEVHGLATAEDARARLLELAELDDRFSPAVVDASLDAIVVAWTSAAGPDDPALLAATDGAAAVEALVHDGERRLLAVTDVLVERAELRAVRDDMAPPLVEVELTLLARHHRPVPAPGFGTMVEGLTAPDPHRRSERRHRDVTGRSVERWQLVLDGGADQPWRLHDVRQGTFRLVDR